MLYYLNLFVLGPCFDENIIEKDLKGMQAIFKKKELKEIISITAKELSNSKTVGWFQGRMEFGPRALGSRSIIADPRSGNMQKILNLKVKYRINYWLTSYIK